MTKKHEYEELLYEVRESIEDVLQQVDVLNAAVRELTKRTITLRSIAGGLGEPPPHNGMFIEIDHEESHQ